MRVLLLLRGSPGCGKTTWIRENGLTDYALSADDIRMMCSAPVLNTAGQMEINQTNDKVVWDTLFRILEIRMRNGEFTVIDATNSKTSEMNRYKELCTEYKYRIYCVDFTGIPIAVVKERNASRPEPKRVPDAVIDKMYSRFETQKIPAGITTIRPDELDRVWMRKTDLTDRYNKVHVIGDIHGCATSLMEYIGEMKNDEFYIFLGDYVDRGLENAEVVKFLLSIYDRENTLLLEGNHEYGMWIWANGKVALSKEFELHTRPQLEGAEIDKKSVRKLYRKMGQCAYFSYGENTYLVTHGGLSTLPDNLTLVSTAQMVKGVGGYNAAESVDAAFCETAGGAFQIHGHRNVKALPVRVNDRCFDLEGKVEFGGHLRCVDIFPDGEIKTVEIKNNIFKEQAPEQTAEAGNDAQSVGDAIIALRKNRYVQEKQFGDISSFNFTKSAFYDKVWDAQTTKARGLYINIPQQRIVARAYEKFFNINERPETKFDQLQQKLRFPVTAYVKENGFLGIVSYDLENDGLFITTKSNPDGDYASWLRDMFYAALPAETVDAIRDFSKENDVSFLFECVDMHNDPHVIEYPESGLYLLDIVYNRLQYEKLPYEELCEFADKNGIKHKEKAYVLENWQDFFDWYYLVTGEDYQYEGRNIEGFVIEDASGYMIKLKLAYYNFWKFMRSISHETLAKGYVARNRLSALLTPLANQYYGWVKTLYNEENTEKIPKDICALRKLFYQSETGRPFTQEQR